MKIRLATDCELPGGFVIEAENPSECLILRAFCNEKRPIGIANWGGNFGENRVSMFIKHQPKPKEPQRVTTYSPER